MNVPEVMRPYEVRGTALACAIIGVINLIQGWQPLYLTLALYDDVDFPMVYLLSVVFTIVIGVLLLAAAVMIVRHRKRGLQFGLVANILFLGNELYFLVRGGQPEAVTWLQMLLSIVALYFLYRHLTHDPERYQFS